MMQASVRLGGAALLLSLFLSGPVEAGFPGTDVVVPAVARISGLNGAEFTSTLWITNLSSSVPAQVELRYHERSDQGGVPPVVRQRTIGAGRTERIDNVVEQVFGRRGSSGAIRVVSSTDLFVSSRTFDLPTGSDIRDAKGLFFGGIPVSFSIGAGESALLQGVTQGTGEDYRYNFGIVETSGQPVSVAVTLRDGAGSLLVPQKTYSIGAYQAVQYNVSDLGAVVTENGLLELRPTAGPGKVVFYGTQVANGSNDSSGFEMSFKTSLLGSLTGVLAGPGLTGGGTSGTVTLSVAPSGIQGSMLAPGSVTAAKVYPGQLVQSLNGLRDDVTLQAGTGISVASSGNAITVSAAAGAGGAALRYRIETQQAIPVGVTSLIDFSLREYDSRTPTVTTGPGWSFRAPASGIYHVTCSVSLGNITTVTPDTDGFLLLYRNGSPYAGYGSYRTNVNPAYIGTDVLLNAGDTLDARYENRTGTIVIARGDEGSWIAIHYVRSIP